MINATLLNLLPHLRAVSAATNQYVMAEQWTEFTDFVYVDAFYAHHRGGRKTIARKWSGYQPNVLLRDGVVMASRGLDNVTDVCEAMRADLARRNGGQS